jgi:hypothetical protein
MPRASQIQNLVETVEALRAKTETYFPITRLTSLKRLCADSTVAAQFVFYLANCVHQKSRSKPPSRFTKAADWKRYQAIIAKAVVLMRKHLRVPSAETREQLYEIRTRAEAVQEYTGKHIWGSAIRSIHSRDVLVIEDALNGILQPEASSFWAYQTARDYAERYNSRYGTGLIPESVPALEDIIGFWRRREPPTANHAPNHAAHPKAKTPRRSPAPGKQTGENQSHSFAQSYPAIAEWIGSHGWIEIGKDDYRRSMVRAMDSGGMVWEGSTHYASQDALWLDLERGLTKWNNENG